LRYAGFDILSIANNHIWDYGRPAFDDTIAILASSGVRAVGGGRTIDEARGPVVVTVRGTRIAYLAYTDILSASSQATPTMSGANRYDAMRMAEDIARARMRADVVVVSFHTGTEYEPYHNATQERIYRAAIDAGADLIVGHHPHVVQDIERYKNKWIVYSLGNFIFDQNWSLATRQGMLLDVVVENGSIASLATRSVDISTQYQPSLR
jgi:poly-gamma-glutamate synthesis protein (capsule biosynthesis protein)